jgi:hypothetical protein
MDEREKPALEKAADEINDAVEEIALKAADASIEPDPEHVAGKSNEQPVPTSGQRGDAMPDQSGRITTTADTEFHSPIKKAVNKEKANH